jgi:hypothetical protein
VALSTTAFGPVTFQCFLRDKRARETKPWSTRAPDLSDAGFSHRPGAQRRGTWSSLLCSSSAVSPEWPPRSVHELSLSHRFYLLHELLGLFSLFCSDPLAIVLTMTGTLDVELTGSPRPLVPHLSCIPVFGSSIHQTSKWNGDVWPYFSCSRFHMPILPSKKWTHWIALESWVWETHLRGEERPFTANSHLPHLPMTLAPTFDIGLSLHHRWLDSGAQTSGSISDTWVYH